MPPKPRKRASEVADYESDGGFVADDNDNDDKPKAKRAKTTKSSASATNTGGSRKDARAVHDKEVVGGGAVDANGDEYFEVRPCVRHRARRQTCPRSRQLREGC